MKIRPEHIPVGSVVEYMVTNTPVISTVQGCQKNGNDSYIFKADDVPESTLPTWINLDYITRIISRGKSSVCYLEPEWSRASFQVNKAVISWYLRDAIFAVLNKSSRRFENIDVDQMLKDLRKAIFPMRFVKANWGDHAIYRRKTIFKWVKNNINRYLTSKKLLNKLERRANQFDLSYEDDLYEVSHYESQEGRSIANGLISTLEELDGFKWGIVGRHVIADNCHLSVEYFSLKLKEGDSHECVFATDAFEVIEKFVQSNNEEIQISRFDGCPKNISSPETFIGILRDPDSLKVVDASHVHNDDIHDIDGWIW